MFISLDAEVEICILLASSWSSTTPSNPSPAQLGLLSLSKGWILMLSFLAGAVHTHGNEPEPTKTWPSLILGSEDGDFYPQMAIEAFRKGWLLWENNRLFEESGERNLFWRLEILGANFNNPPNQPLENYHCEKKPKKKTKQGPHSATELAPRPLLGHPWEWPTIASLIPACRNCGRERKGRKKGRKGYSSLIGPWVGWGC